MSSPSWSHPQPAPSPPPPPPLWKWHPPHSCASSSSSSQPAPSTSACRLQPSPPESKPPALPPSLHLLHHQSYCFPHLNFLRPPPTPSFATPSSSPSPSS